MVRHRRPGGPNLNGIASTERVIAELPDKPDCR
jgi:hypothetical protein